MKHPILLAALSVLGFSTVSRAEVRLVKDLNVLPGDYSAAVGWMLPVEEGVVFTMATQATGNELWINDGTRTGTRLLKELTPGTAGTEFREPRQAGTKVAFIAKGLDGTDKLWFTDGTEAGTLMVLDSAPLGGRGQLAMQAGLDGGVFFRVLYSSPGPTHAELWFSDGTVAGTRVLDPRAPDYTQTNGGTGFTSGAAGAYFIANQHEIWHSDGTVDGTGMVVDIAPLDGLRLARIEAGTTRLYLVVELPDYRQELWTCSLAGEDLARLSPQSWGGAEIQELVVTGDAATLRVTNENYVMELWHSDGTPKGTRQLPMAHRGKADYVPSHSMVAWKGAVYFWGYTEPAATSLWRTDGTAAGTRVIHSLSGEWHGGVVGDLIPADDFLYFELQNKSVEQELWRSNGTSKGTRRVSLLLDRGFSPWGAASKALWKGDLFFVASRGLSADALWKTRPAGRAGVERLTVPEKSTGSAFPGGASYEEMAGEVLAFLTLARNSSPELYRIGAAGAGRAIWTPRKHQSMLGERGIRGKAGGKAIFTVGSYTTEGQTVWGTDGTPRGTRRLAVHGHAADLRYFVEAGDLLFYTAWAADPYYRKLLWRTDGTPEGTMSIVPTDSGAPLPMDGEMVALGDTLYFLSSSGQATTALWRSNGTPAGTRMVSDIAGTATRLAVIGERLSFAVGGIYYQNLGTSDGTAEGTRVYFNPDDRFVNVAIGPAVDLDGLQIFQVKKGTDPVRWYRSDGTGAGIRPLVPGLSSQVDYVLKDAAGNVGTAGGTFFYPGIASVASVADRADSELWAADASGDTSWRVKDINPGPRGSSPGEFVTVGDVVYFAAESAGHGRELWKSDGTEAGTVMVADLEPGLLGSYPRGLKVMNGKLHFTAYRAPIGWELYVVD